MPLAQEEIFPVNQGGRQQIGVRRSAQRLKQSEGPPAHWTEARCPLPKMPDGRLSGAAQTQSARTDDAVAARSRPQRQPHTRVASG